MNMFGKNQGSDRDWGYFMSHDNTALHLQAKYMALAHSTEERNRIDATELAKKLLKLPIRHSRDMNAKLKILEMEISNLKEVDPRSRFKLLELVAVLAQAELSIEPHYSFQTIQTKH